MEAGTKRVSLDMEAPMQRRLKAVAASKGVSMRRYCLTAIDKELAVDEANAASDGTSRADRFEELQRKHFGGRVLPGNSADLIREAREIRDAQLDAIP